MCWYFLQNTYSSPGEDDDVVQFIDLDEMIGRKTIIFGCFLLVLGLLSTTHGGILRSFIP